ncbi:protein FAR1-RELATED SEQUENCE 5-like [Cornus florida]|uniref:protein FAR1-RELATED SEQUENCE 5-like n=1 Tax=Cornus florida TaxID=4283 RepID=UPI00289F30F9|nr:protein FAR1-RELATED SEQUENCE 5-like [Cornus florida]
MESLDDDIDDLKIGMRVSSENEAYKLYCKYALRKGFGVRKGNFRYTSGGVIKQREFLCANAGQYRDGDPFNPKKIRRLVTRTGCKALIKFVIAEGIWEISYINDEHNHNFVDQEERQFLRISRNIDSASASVLNSMVGAGIKGTKAYSYLSKEVGGSENVGFTLRDCQNFVNEKKKSLIQRGDAQSVIKHFKQCRAEDHIFFHSEELDAEGRLANFFWRDGRSRLDYDYFGDVVVFDTTYRTNRYDMIFAPFVGVNHHRKNILFGCAFLVDETTDSFVWLFEEFLEAMDNKAPKTIFTDQCQAMANAIKKVFPNTCHRLCSWHISKNATQKLGTLYGNYEFKTLFQKCLHSEAIDDFESTWSLMITKFGIADNKWLKSLYGLREKWCPAFSLDTFTLRAKSTQRSESMNNVLQKMSSKAMTLMEFVQHYEEQCEKMRLAEANEDYRSKHGIIQMKAKDSKMLKQATCVYTNNIYYLFEDEVLSSLAVKLELLSNLQSSFIVLLWEVFNLWNIHDIPSQYILERWTKYVKSKQPPFEVGGSSRNKKSSLTLERSILLQQSYRAINHLVMTAEGKSLAKKHVQLMWEDAQKLMETFNPNKENDNTSSDLTKIGGHLEEMIVLDPSHVKAKGVTNARIKSYLEKRKRRQKKGQPLHNTYNVPSAPVLSLPPVHAPTLHSFGQQLHTNIFNPGVIHTSLQCEQQVRPQSAMKEPENEHIDLSNQLFQSLLDSIQHTELQRQVTLLGGKLKTQNDVDSVSVKLDRQIRDFGVLIKSGVLHDDAVLRSSKRESDRVEARNLITRLQIGSRSEVVVDVEEGVRTSRGSEVDNSITDWEHRVEELGVGLTAGVDSGGRQECVDCDGAGDHPGGRRARRRRSKRIRHGRR